jgi:hypothetical protein
MAWLLHGCEHSGGWGFALGLWATLATVWGLYNYRSAQSWRRAFMQERGCQVRD